VVVVQSHIGAVSPVVDTIVVVVVHVLGTNLLVLDLESLVANLVKVVMK